MREGRPPLLDEHWKAYTPRRWQSIRADFGVTDVLVPSEIPLPLPLVAASGHLALYTIPRLTTDPAAGAALGTPVAGSAASRATISSREGPSAAFGR